MKTLSGGPDNRFSVRGRVLVDGRLIAGAVIVEREAITEVRTGDLDSSIPSPVFDTDIVSPGLIDLQVNGGFGLEVGGDAGALRSLAARLPATGVTTFLPTLVSATAEVYRAGAAALAAAPDAPGARMPGLHLEGPLLSLDRVGAHDRPPIFDAAETLAAVLDELVSAGALKLMTLAPERPDALALISRLRAAGVAVSLGHTDATWGEMVAGIDAGATLVTHLYSAMRGFHHREPGAVGAALTDPRVAVAVIADGVHAHPAALNLALRAKGAGGVVLVTDAVAAAGSPPGTYPLGGAPRVISDGQAARLADGTLAGSTLTLDRAVRNMISMGGASVEEALTMATATAARVLGRDDLGRVAPGCAADLVLWDHSMHVQATYLRGQRVFG